MELTLIIMLSKTKKVFTTYLTVLCSIASLKTILSAMWKSERLSLLFVPPTWRRNGDYYGEIRIYPSFKQRPEYRKAGGSHAGNWTDKEADVY